MRYRPDKYQPLDEELRSGNSDPEVAEELRGHLAMRIEENVARGMSRPEAEAEARRRFGDLERYRRETGAVSRAAVRERRRSERFGLWLTELGRGARALVRSPTFSVTALLTMAIAIGAATAIGTVLDRVVLRPLQYPAADRLVRIYHPVPGVGRDARWNVAQAELFYFQRHSRTLAQVAAFDIAPLTMVVGGAGRPVRFGGASPGLLPLLGARPLLGRLFTEDDSRTADRGQTIVLTEPFWRRAFGADPGVIGREVRLEGNSARVIGVVAGQVGLPDWPVEAWGAMALDPAAPPRNNHYLKMVARLRDGASAAAASRELAGFVARYPEELAPAYTSRFLRQSRFTTIAVPWTEDVVGNARTVLWTLFGSVAVVLLIACLNVANLFVVRAQARQREIAVRAMLGAGRGQLAWHHAAESLLLAGAAGLLGLAVAWVALHGFLAFVPAGLTRNGVALPRLGEIGLGWASAGFAGLVSLLAGVGFGLVPMVLAPPPEVALRRGGRQQTASRPEVVARSVLVVGQIGLALVLLSAAGLMMRTFRNLAAVSPGFDPAGVMAADLALPFGRYQRYEETTAFFRRLLDRVRRLPGVTEAGIGSDLPAEASDGCSVYVYREAAPGDYPCVMSMVATPGYAATLGLSVEGREPTWADLDAHTGAAMISEPLARRLWAGERALGREVRGPSTGATAPYHIVGVIKGLRLFGLDRPPAEFGYFPIEPVPGAPLWYPPHRVSLVAKVGAGRPEALAAAVAGIVSELDPEASLANARSMDSVLARSTIRVRLLLLLIGITSVMALFLAAVGLYGAMAYGVSRRTFEIGIRIALGASNGAVRVQVVREAMALASIGTLLGVAGSLSVTRYLESALYGVRPSDPFTIAGAALILFLVALIAAIVPAHRATTIGPLIGNGD